MWAIEQGFDEIVVKTKNRFYDMRGTLDHLRFEVVKYERHAADNAESKVYLEQEADGRDAARPPQRQDRRAGQHLTPLPAGEGTMTAPDTPYTKYLDGRDPLQVIPESLETIARLSGAWTPDRFERSYAPGKWSARQVLIHLAQTELALGSRARMALSTPGYTAQAFDQEVWIRFDTSLSGREAAKRSSPPRA